MKRTTQIFLALVFVQSTFSQHQTYNLHHIRGLKAGVNFELKSSRRLFGKDKNKKSLRSRLLTGSDQEKEDESPYEFLGFSLAGSSLAVGICYFLNNKRRRAEKESLRTKLLEMNTTTSAESSNAAYYPSASSAPPQPDVENLDKFHTRVQHVAYAIRRKLSELSYDDVGSRLYTIPQTGLYKGTKNASDITLTLIFSQAEDPEGYTIEGFGKDPVGETIIHTGFVNRLGEMYWVEERYRQGSGCSIKYTTGKYNFLTNEFLGWFESNDGLRGRCDLTLVSASNHEHFRLTRSHRRRNTFAVNGADLREEVYQGSPLMRNPVEGSYRSIFVPTSGDTYRASRLAEENVANEDIFIIKEGVSGESSPSEFPRNSEIRSSFSEDTELCKNTHIKAKRSQRRHSYACRAA